MLYDNEEKTQSAGTSPKPPVPTASTTPSAASPTRQSAWMQAMGKTPPAAVQVPATAADQHEFVNTAIEFLHSGAEYYRAGSVVDESRLHRQLISWNETLLGSLSIIRSSLNDDPVLEQKLRQAYQDAVHALMAGAASQLKRTPQDLYESYKGLIHEWAWMFATETILGTTKGGRPVTAYFFPGTTDERALIIGGVHGSEQAGIQVATMLVDSLRTGPKPYYSVIIVPTLFPDNYAVAQAAHKKPSDDNTGRYTQGNPVDPNRNFPAPGESLASAQSRGGGVAKDERGRPIQPENVMLLELIDRFRPSRIASVHSIRPPTKLVRGKAAAGIFADPHTVPKGASSTEQSSAAAASAQDAALALRMAQRAAQGGARVPGNWLSSAHPESLYGAASHQPGTSMGGWAPQAVVEHGPQDRPAMTIITVEVHHFHPSSVETTVARQATRLHELEAHRDTLQEIFLGPPSP